MRALLPRTPRRAPAVVVAGVLAAGTVLTTPPTAAATTSSTAMSGPAMSGTAVSGPAVSGTPTPGGASTAPRIGHVFVVNLENEDYATTFGPSSPAPYLSRTLVAQGNLLTQYHGIGHNSLDNYIAQISGQAPDVATQGDCQVYADFIGTGTVAPGQAVGQGCVYPSSVRTVADQLRNTGRTWKGYMEDMGNTPSRESATCGHPALNSVDGTQKATPADQYATRHDPFVYFHSIIDSPVCQRSVVPLTRLRADLASTGTTPDLAYITPDLCHDGHDSPCADGEPGGLVSADAFLRSWVPRITASPAFRRDGLLVITFDESDGPQGDSSACCGPRPGPNSPLPGITGPGGGRVGAVVLGPSVRPGTTTARPYDHYALLASIERAFGLPRLGYASRATPFGDDVYTAVR